MKTIKVNKDMLKDRKIAKIFRSEVGTQLYLAIGTTHLRSQYFSDAILGAMRHIEKMKTRPTTVQELRDVLSSAGYQDSAVSRCHPRPQKPYICGKVEPGSCGNWEQWNRDIDAKIARHEAAVKESDDKIMDIVNALNGKEQWKADIV